jgi:hypothetical protein
MDAARLGFGCGWWVEIFRTRFSFNHIAPKSKSNLVDIAHFGGCLPNAPFARLEMLTAERS